MYFFVSKIVYKKNHSLDNSSESNEIWFIFFRDCCKKIQKILLTSSIRKKNILKYTYHKGAEIE